LILYPWGSIAFLKFHFCELDVFFRKGTVLSEFFLNFFLFFVNSLEEEKAQWNKNYGFLER